MRSLRSSVIGSLAVLALAVSTSMATAVALPETGSTGMSESAALTDETPTTQAAGAATSRRAVVVIEGGGSSHPFTTPWAACSGGRATYVQALVDAGLPVFTAPGYTNLATSTDQRSGCPPQPPLEVQWNTSAYPTQAGESVLGFLGYLRANYGYDTFDLVGYSYGGVIARATVAALKQRPPAGSFAPGFSYAHEAVEAGVSIPSIVTMNSPHFGGPAYDIAADPARFMRPVAKAWGRQFARQARSLIDFQRTLGAGSIQVLVTSAHAKRNSTSWDAQQVGMLEGVALTLMAGDFCGRTCADDREPTESRVAKSLRTDGTVPVHSQLMLPCPSACPTPPASVYIPPGLLPQANVVRKTFPTLHSTYDAKGLKLPESLSVSKNPEAIAYLVSTVTSTWQASSVPLLTRP